MKYLNTTIRYLALLSFGILSVSAFVGPSEPPTDEVAASYDDMEIAHIAYTAGMIDIRYAHLALAVSEDDDVRTFARTMLRDHAAVNERALALLEDLGASPKDNPTSRKLLADAKEIRSELAGLDGPAFDKRYAENELSYHRFVNTTVEDQFIPAVENERFRDLLGEALSVFREHERHAERMNKSLRE